MQIIHISDTHCHHNKLNLESGDLLIHTGDFTSFGYEFEVKDFISWLVKQASKYTYGAVFIAGNHDRSFDPKYNREYYDSADLNTIDNEKPNWVKEVIEQLPENVKYLENSSVNIGGINIWGSPITPWFYGDRWAFNQHRGLHISETWDKIPKNTNILLTHGPAKFKQDWVERGSDYVGCDQLSEKIKHIKPNLHLFGHVHESFGWSYDKNTVYVNSSFLNLYHNAYNGYHLIDLSEDVITPIKKQ